MKEVEHSIASNVEKDVEVGAKCTESRTSLMEVPLHPSPLLASATRRTLSFHEGVPRHGEPFDEQVTTVVIQHGMRRERY